MQRPAARVGTRQTHLPQHGAACSHNDNLINKSFLVLFFKKELLFEKRSKNFCKFISGAPPAELPARHAPIRSSAGIFVLRDPRIRARTSPPPPASPGPRRTGQ